MKLSDWLTKYGRTDDWLADLVGRDRTVITKIKNGVIRPSNEVAAKIQLISDGSVTAIDHENAYAARRRGKRSSFHPVPGDQSAARRAERA